MRKMLSRLKERKKGSVAGLLRWGKSGLDKTTDWGVEVILRKLRRSERVKTSDQLVAIKM